MFVYRVRLVPRPFEEVSRRLLDSPERWLPPVMEASRVMIGFGKGARIKMYVTTLSDEVVRAKDRAVLRFKMRVVNHYTLAPEFNFEFAAAAIGEDLTQLTLRGSYSPPLGSVGAILDHILLHRLADIAIGKFLKKVSERLEEPPIAVGRSA